MLFILVCHFFYFPFFYFFFFLFSVYSTCVYGKVYRLLLDSFIQCDTDEWLKYFSQHYNGFYHFFFDFLTFCW